MFDRYTIILVVVVLLANNPVVCLEKSSALRMCDSADCQLQLMLTSQRYTFYIPTVHLKANPRFVFCWRERTTVPGDSQTCTLQGGIDGSYTCFDLSPTDSSFSKIDATSWTADASLLNPNKSNPTTLTNFTSISTTQVLFNIHTYLKTSKIYEVYAGYQTDLLADPRTKNSFFMTYQFTNQSASDNLLMQRNVACFLFYYQQYYNYNLLFYGGAVRGGNDTLFIHVLSYLVDSNGAPANVSLNVWIGITYSLSGHPGRDMMVFISDNYTTFDMFSHYYSAPYLDTSPNVKGTVDVIDIGDSNIYGKGASTYFYWSGGSRKYETGDSLGDQTIMKKMNATLGYAIGYNPSTGPYSPLLVENKHNYSNTVYFNVAVWQPFFLVPLLNLMLTYILFT